MAVSDPNEAGRAAAQKRLEANQAYSDYRKMLADEQLDIVAICPRWLDQHHDMVLEAAKVKRIYVEKSRFVELWLKQMRWLLLASRIRSS